MICADIFQDTKDVIGLVDETVVFDRISDAVEVFTNKDEFDAQESYISIPIPEDGKIVLPREVEVPLNVNINDHPTFARDRLYEFSQDGPGSNATLTEWSWVDKGLTPVIRQPYAAFAISALGSSVDNGKTITIEGRNDTGAILTETLILNSFGPPTTNTAFVEILNVHKDLTVYPVALADESNTTLSIYQYFETNPTYRQIRVSATSGTAYIRFRRTRFRIYSQRDFIPVRSKMGLLWMIKANEAYRKDNFQLGQALEQQSTTIAKEEQARHNSFIDLAKANENAPTLGLQYANRDSIIVADIYDEACNILGPIGQRKIFDRITEAVTCLSNKAQWDAQRGYVDIETDNLYYFTAPRYVDEIIKISLCGQPLEARSKWFQFHLGVNENCDWFSRGWSDAGNVVTIRDVPYTQTLKAVAEFPADNGLELRVYGYYVGKRIFTPDASGNNVDGFPVTVDINGMIKSTQPVDRIEEIVKPQSQGFITLFGYDNNDESETVLGYYWPDETRPNYRKIKLPRPCACITLMYRRRELKYTSLSDPIHLRSKMAVLLMLSSYQNLMAGKLSDAQAMEDKAVMLLMEEQRINNQSEIPVMEFAPNFAYGYQGSIR